MLLLLLTSSAATANDQIRVAVIDTGFGYGGAVSSHLCPTGHWDFVGQNTNVADTNGHGTNIAGLIEQHAGDANFCIIVLRFYSPYITGTKNLENEINAMKRALALKVDFINISGGGPMSEPAELKVLGEILKKGIKVVVAAGNEKHDLNKECDYYPACYKSRVKKALKKGLTVVGNLNKNGSRAPSSNHGSVVNVWEVGENQTAYGLTNSGTSQATAVTTGKLIRSFRKKHESDTRSR